MWQRKSLLPGPNSGEIKSSLNVGSYVTSVQFSPSGDTVAASYVTSVHYGVVQIIDVATAEVKRPALTTRHSSLVRSVSWSPDGTKLASGSKDKTLRTWEVATGKELSQLNVEGQGSSVDWSPCGSKMAAACNVFKDGWHGSVKIFTSEGSAGTFEST